MKADPQSFPSLQMVATAAGVAKSTASLALRNDPRVSLGTQQHVQQIACNLGYRSNAVIAELMSKLRGSRRPDFQAPLALVNCSSDSNFFNLHATYRRWVKGLTERAEELGYKIDYFWAEDPKIKPSRLGSIFRARNIRGAIIACGMGQRKLSPALRFLWESYPSAVLGSTTEPRLHMASNDQHATATYAVRELFSRGYRRFGLMRYPVQDFIVDHRFSAGFLAVCRELTGQIDACSILDIFDPFAIELQFRKWVRKERLDAILSVHRDTRFWLASERQRTQGDVAIVHLDWDPSLAPESGMDQNSEAIGAAAVDLVIGQIHRNERGVPRIPKCVCIESSWVEGTASIKAR